MLTPGQLFAEAQRIVDNGYAPVEQVDRHAMALALFFQGYSAGQACQKAFVELEDTDGALQMLARHRLAAPNEQPPSKAGIVALLADMQRLRQHHEFTRDRVGQPGCPVRREAAEYVETIDRARAALTEQPRTSERGK